jgi:hypothetical protein
MAAGLAGSPGDARIASLAVNSWPVLLYEGTWRLADLMRAASRSVPVSPRIGAGSA